MKKISIPAFANRQLVLYGGNGYYLLYEEKMLSKPGGMSYADMMIAVSGINVNLLEHYKRVME